MTPSSSSLGRATAPSSGLLRFLRAQVQVQAQNQTQSQAQSNGFLHQQQSCAGMLRRHTRSVHTVATLRESIRLSNAYSTSRKRIAASQTHIHAPIPSRAASTSARSKSFVEFTRAFSRFFGGKEKRPAAPLEPNDLPRLSGFLDDNSSLGRPLRPGNELKLRCTEFDENGNVTLVNGEFKKSELIAKYGLLPRDLRKVDSSLLPHILVRPSAILINLLHLRALIKHNRVLVFDAYGSTDTYTQSLFMYDLEGKLRTPEARTTISSSTHANTTLPYEFRALEAVLISVTSGLEGEFEGVREPVVRVLRELEEDIDRDKLRHLLIYSKKIGTFEQKARLVRDAIDDLLEADDDLAAMYLTEKVKGVERADDDHTEIEMLLESYHKVCDEIVQRSGNLVSNIRNTEEIVKAILDANRNSLMLLDLKFSIGTLGLGGGTFVAALYGMNLKNFIEESDFGFWGVSLWCTVFSAFVCVVGLRKLRTIQRLSMWGGDRADRTRGKSGWSKLGDLSGGNESTPRALHGRAMDRSRGLDDRLHAGHGEVYEAPAVVAVQQALSQQQHSPTQTPSSSRTPAIPAVPTPPLLPAKVKKVD